MSLSIFRRRSFQPRTDIKCKHDHTCNIKKLRSHKNFNLTGEINCCICDLKQVALPINVNLKEALANRLRGQSLGEYPFSKTQPLDASLRSCVPLYCGQCGNVICLECIQKWNLNDRCPECGTRLKYLKSMQAKYL